MRIILCALLLCCGQLYAMDNEVLEALLEEAMENAEGEGLEGALREALERAQDAAVVELQLLPEGAASEASSESQDTAEPSEQAEGATLLTWAGGPLPLDQVTTWLSSSGNETELINHRGGEGNTSGEEFPFTAGSYWEAVMACVDYHGLTLEPSKRSIYFSRSLPMDTGLQHPPVGISPVRLLLERDVPERPSQWHERLIFAGPILIQVKDARVSQQLPDQHATLEISYSARIEPRFGEKNISYVLVKWKELGQGNQRIPWTGNASNYLRNMRSSHIHTYITNRESTAQAMAESDEPLHLSGLDLDATLEIVYAQPESIERTMKADEKTTFKLGGLEADWKMSYAGPKEENKIVIESPQEAGHRSQLEIEVTGPDGEKARLRSRSTRWGHNGAGTTYTYQFHGVEKTPVTIKISTQRITGESSHPMATQLQFATMPNE